MGPDTGHPRGDGRALGALDHQPIHVMFEFLSSWASRALDVLVAVVEVVVLVVAAVVGVIEAAAELA